jgi:hypothetical protein
VYEQLCKDNDFDFGVFDGGGFGGDNEFWSAMEFCKSMRYVAFDDVKENKYWLLYHQMKNNDDWTELYSSFLDEKVPDGKTKFPRHGWAVFERKL